MPRTSAGLLAYHRSGDVLQVFLLHPGGPLWVRRDDGAWSLPKGEYDPATESDRDVAAREFAEEVGVTPPDADWLALGSATMPSRKVVTAWAVPADLSLRFVASNHFEMEWPPKSGRLQSFPEMDRGEWYDVPQARVKLMSGQLPFLDRLIDLLDVAAPTG